MSHRHPPAFEPDFSKQPEQQLQVVVHAGPLAGKGFLITGDEITFGRDQDNNIFWDDSLVSRHHARLARREDQLILEDLGSTNGTLVNGQPIVGQHILQPADIISIGSSVFGVKGFAAPHTMGITQLSSERPPYPLPAPTLPPPPPAPTAVSHRPSPPAQSGEPKLNMLAVGGILALVVIILSLAAITAYLFIRGQGSTVAQVPVVNITAPVNGSEVQLNLPVTVQATAFDPSGVVRMELWVNGVKTAETTSPGQSTLTASLQWVPVTPGSYTLAIKAYNAQNGVNEPASVGVITASAPPVEDTPTPTSTPEPPTATVPLNPALTTQTDLNVRTGPGTEYDLIGLLPSGTSTEIIGRDENRQWWQIRFNPAPDRLGWVSADSAFATASNVDNVPVVQVPATPTGTPTPTLTPTPTETPVPPTETPTETPVPPTETPTVTPTPTATEESEKIEFNVSSTVIQGGECVTVRWSVSGVKEVYYQGEGVSGVGDRKECPKETKTYRLRVIKRDNSEHIEDRQVEVINPIVSAGTITLDPDETVDLDKGEIPGDDFKWDVGDGIRKFEIREGVGVQLAPKGELDSLTKLTLAECVGADYDTYTFIDGSDVTLDPVNRLTSGRTACYRTNQGRLGKVRFPEYSPDSLRIEWLTWK